MYNNALSSIINGKKDFCCLCFQSLNEEVLHLFDEVAINIDETTTFADILNSVLDDKTFNYITAFESICGRCAKSVITCYTFIQTSYNNAKNFTNILEGISNGFEFTTEELLNDSKSLYVSFNCQDLTMKQYYDMKSTPTTKTRVLQRFTALDNQEQKNSEKLSKKVKRIGDDETDKPRRKKNKNYIDIKTSDMLYDKNNQESLQCKECLKSFPTFTNLRNHFIRVHAPKVFKCSECPRRYGSKAFLEVHKSESHCSIVCSECGLTINNKQTLKIHEMGHHLTLVCEDCGRVYKNKSTFKKHKESNVCGQKTRAHPSNAKYTCDYCNKKYTQKVSLRVHIQYEHGNYKAHICEWCGKKFWAPSRLKAHIVKHTRERNFSCDICGGKFVTKESLLYHTRTHTGENPYKCDYCDSRFPCSSRRSDHIKRQHVGATLECNICHIKFNSRKFLQNHKKIHLKKEEKANMKLNDMILNLDKSQSVPIKTHLSSVSNKDLWKIEALDDITISNCNLDGYQFTHQVNDDSQLSSECKVYLEVPDDSNEFNTMLRMSGNP